MQEKLKSQIQKQKWTLCGIGGLGRTYRYWTFQYLNNIEVVSKAIVIRYNTFDNISISTEKIKLGR